MAGEPLSAERRRIDEQRVAAMQGRAGLDAQQAARAADVAGAFARQHPAALMRAFVPRGGVSGDIGRRCGWGKCIPGGMARRRVSPAMLRPSSSRAAWARRDAALASRRGLAVLWLLAASVARSGTFPALVRSCHRAKLDETGW